MNTTPSNIGPLLPLPEPLRGSDPHSFAQRTLSQRLPGIARRVLRSNPWHMPAKTRLQALADEMPHGKLRPLDDPQAPDAAAWEVDFAPYLGLTWLEAPWFVVETYFFRRILEATGYYQTGPGFHVDPYRSEKHFEQEHISSHMHSLCAHLEVLSTPNRLSGLENPALIVQFQKKLAAILRANIWGNQADRSMWPAGSREAPSFQPNSRPDEHLLVDHSDQVAEFFSRQEALSHRVDLILDNSGIELAYDLGLVDFLLARPFTQEFYLHAKAHPTYVSDVSVPDIFETIDHLQAAAHDCLRRLAERLRGYLDDGKLKLQTDYFWTSPLSGWEMHEELRSELGKADLIFSKGDANYRRWLGDRHWLHTTPVDEILAYFPTSMVMLRVLKANLIAGLPSGLTERMNSQDPEWLHNGKWGIIQAARLP